MMQENIGVKEIWQVDEKKLGICWTDDQENTYDVVGLRRACPCAMCVDEMTGKKILKDEDVPDTVRPVTIDSVGRYALTIRFNDGHETGIYTFDYLKKIASKAS